MPRSVPYLLRYHFSVLAFSLLFWLGSQTQQCSEITPSRTRGILWSAGDQILWQCDLLYSHSHPGFQFVRFLATGNGVLFFFELGGHTPQRCSDRITGSMLWNHRTLCLVLTSECLGYTLVGSGITPGGAWGVLLALCFGVVGFPLLKVFRGP